MLEQKKFKTIDNDPEEPQEAHDRLLQYGKRI
jgi:hypothetical protein